MFNRDAPICSSKTSEAVYCLQRFAKISQYQRRQVLVLLDPIRHGINMHDPCLTSWQTDHHLIADGGAITSFCSQLITGIPVLEKVPSEGS